MFVFTVFRFLKFRQLYHHSINLLISVEFCCVNVNNTVDTMISELSEQRLLPCMNPTCFFSRVDRSQKESTCIRNVYDDGETDSLLVF